MFHCSSTIYRKDELLSVKLPLQLCQYSVDYVYAGLFLGSLFSSIGLCVYLFYPIPSYLDYCSLEVGWCDSSNFVLLFCFGYSRSFSFSCKFWSHFVKIYELTWWELDWDCIGISRIDILTILNLLIHK